VSPPRRRGRLPSVHNQVEAGASAHRATGRLVRFPYVATDYAEDTRSGSGRPGTHGGPNGTSLGLRPDKASRRPVRCAVPGAAPLDEGWPTDGWEEREPSAKRPARRYYVLTDEGIAELGGLLAAARNDSRFTAMTRRLA
jgi:hypothetical protein